MHSVSPSRYLARPMDSIYLDACATTPLDPEVQALLVGHLQSGHVNPSSQHQPGQRANRLIEDARQGIRDSLRIPRAAPLVLVSGGTEANNQAVFGACDGRPTERTSSLVVSAIEHPSILAAAGELERRDWEVRHLPVDSQGVARVDQLESLLDCNTRLVSLMLVNNETGVIQPVGEAARICAAHRIPLHCDAVQAVGKIPVHVDELVEAGVSLLTFSAHKIHGPRGIGGLILAGPDVPWRPLLYGGYQQLGLRPGTEDVALAAACELAVRKATGDLPDVAARLAAMRDRLESRILNEIPDAVVIGRGAPRAPHCSNIGFPGHAAAAQIERQPLMLGCDMAGLAISTGSACASGSSEPSHVLQAMGIAPDLIDSSVRISFSRFNQEPEIDQAVDRIIKVVKHLRQAKSARF